MTLKTVRLAGIGLVLIGVLFLGAGIDKIFGLEPTQQFMEAFNIPGVLVYSTILLQVGVGLALILNTQVIWSAVALMVFSVVATAIFHSDLSSFPDRAVVMSNIAVLGECSFWLRNSEKPTHTEESRQSPGPFRRRLSKHWEIREFSKLLRSEARSI